MCVNGCPPFLVSIEKSCLDKEFFLSLYVNRRLSHIQGEEEGLCRDGSE